MKQLVSDYSNFGELGKGGLIGCWAVINNDLIENKGPTTDETTFIGASFYNNAHNLGTIVGHRDDKIVVYFLEKNAFMGWLDKDDYQIINYVKPDQQYYF